MRNADDPKLKRWLLDNPDRPFTWDGPLKPQKPDVDSCLKPGETGQPLVFEDMDGKDFGAVIDMLLYHGVAPVDANRFVCSCVRSKKPVTFHELYGQGGLTDAASSLPASLNITGLAVLDLRTTKPDGQPWDFRKSRTVAWP